MIITYESNKSDWEWLFEKWLEYRDDYPYIGIPEESPAHTRNIYADGRMFREMNISAYIPGIAVKHEFRIHDVEQFMIMKMSR